MNNRDGGSCINNCFSRLIVNISFDVNGRRHCWWLNKSTGNTAILCPSYWKFCDVVQSRTMWSWPHLKHPLWCLWKQSMVRWFFRLQILQFENCFNVDILLLKFFVDIGCIESFRICLLGIIPVRFPYSGVEFRW